MTAPLQVRVAVLPEAGPVLDALRRLHVDIGTVAADRVFADATADMRLLCVAVGDVSDVDDFAYRLAADLAVHAPDALALITRVVELALPLDAACVVFLDIVAIEA